VTITLTCFEKSPDGGIGLARDTRVRWALEEVGQPYKVRGVPFPKLKEPEHLSRHPFGQIPVFEDDGLTLFESGAIIFHLADTYDGLLPDDANARTRAIMWMFAALNSVEPSILDLQNAKFAESQQPWAEQRFPVVLERIHQRLEQLAAHMGDAAWLEHEFTVGDLMMISVLQRLKPSGLLAQHPTLAAYVERGHARPAYKRAYDAQAAFNNP
jgi:glutathione S-transferase